MITIDPADFKRIKDTVVKLKKTQTCQDCVERRAACNVLQVTRAAKDLLELLERIERRQS